jgi:hypothetical protein
MVAATALARRGQRVLLVNSAKGWGGHFTTINVDGLAFDPGMVLMEFTSYASETCASLESYDPNVRNDVGRFCRAVQEYVGDYQRTHEIPTPQMYFHGKIVDDLLIANSLQSLALLPIAQAVRDDLCNWRESMDPAVHASGKTFAKEYEQLDYAAASVANHGRSFHHSLIEPFCRKLLNASSSEVLARYHRVAWLPLFYPETILSFLAGTPQSLPRTRFSHPDGECVGDLTNRLRLEIEQSTNITTIRDRLEGFSIQSPEQYAVDIANHARFTFERGAWGGPPSELLQITGTVHESEQYDRCSITLAFVCIPRKALLREFSVLIVVDESRLVYRVTNQTICSANHDEDLIRLVAELNPEYCAQLIDQSVDSIDWSKLIANELLEIGVVKSDTDIAIVAVRSMKRAFTLPTLHNKSVCGAEIAAAQTVAPNLSLIGPSSGFFSTSFNDQIVQGLKLADEWSS